MMYKELQKMLGVEYLISSIEGLGNVVRRVR